MKMVVRVGNDKINATSIFISNFMIDMLKFFL
jgi:hypothetical protein